MRFQILCFTAAATLLAAPAFAQTAPAAAAAPAASTAAPADSTAAPSHYTTDTTPIGDMLDDPAAKAVLLADIPAVVNNPQIDMARGMTLRAVQAYAPDLSDAELTVIDADLAKLPAK